MIDEQLCPPDLSNKLKNIHRQLCNAGANTSLNYSQIYFKSGNVVCYINNARILWGTWLYFDGEQCFKSIDIEKALSLLSHDERMIILFNLDLIL